MILLASDRFFTTVCLEKADTNKANKLDVVKNLERGVWGEKTVFSPRVFF